MAPPELISQSVPLANVPGLTTAQIKTLNDAWIDTAQELVALAKEPESVRNLLERALGVDRHALDQIIQAAQGVIPKTRALRSIQLEQEAALTDYGLGALLDEPPEVLERRLALPSYEPLSGRFVLPSSVSYLDQLPPVRNQGSRGTCVAHAVLAMREQLETAAGSPPDIDLSEQFVYWWCKEHDGIPNVSGTYVSMGMRCLNEAGAPWEDIWPYVSHEQGDQGQGPPPPAAAHGDPARRTSRTISLNRADITGIKTCIAEGRAVAFSIPVFDSWYYSSATRRWGKITLPLPYESVDGGHAMALVGYQDDPAVPGGGYFLVRNSWQPWSYDGVWQEGYGYIPYAYISRYATAVFSAERVSGAEVYLRDSASDTGVRPAAELTWNSPDIWLRQMADDGGEPQAPVLGQVNALYARITNKGPAYAYNVRVELLAAPLAPYVPPADWQEIGQKKAAWLAPGVHILGPLLWTPAEAGPYAYQARIASADDDLGDWPDPAASNNVAQRHLWLAELAPGETTEVAFDVTGVAGKSGVVSFKVNREDLPEDVRVSPLNVGPVSQHVESAGEADSRGLVDDAVLGAITGGMMLTAGQRRRASLTITLPDDAQIGARHALTISQLQGDEVVGRLTVQVDVI